MSAEAKKGFIISELKDAAGKIDVNADMSAITSEKTDAFYDGDASKWIKYANSLRLRYAMRLSAVDQAKAKAAFEDAASTNNFITTQDEIAQVQEKGGWTDLDGVKRGCGIERCS